MKSNKFSDFQNIINAAVSRRTFLKGGAAFGLNRFISGTELTAGMAACSEKQSLGFNR